MNEPQEYPSFRWFILVTLGLATMNTSIIMISFAPLMGDIAKNLGLNLGAATGAFMGVFNLVIATCCLLGGFLCDRYGVVPVFFVGHVIMILSSLAFPLFAQSFGSAMLLRIIQACGMGPILATASPVAAQWFPEKERGIVMGIQGMTVSLGIAVGFIAAPAAFAETGTWQATMAWLTIPYFAGLVLIAIVGFGPKSPVRSSCGDGSTPASEAHDYKLALRQPVTWLGLFLVFCLCWILSAFNDLTPAYLAIDKPIGIGYGRMTAGKLMMALQIAFMVGAVVSGFIMQKVFKGSARPVIMIGYVLEAAFCTSIMWPAVYSSVGALLIFLITIGFFMAWPVPNALAFVSMHYPPGIAGKIGGMWLGIGLYGGSIGIIVGSIALHRTGNYHTSIVIVGILALIGLILSAFLKPPKIFCAIDEGAVRDRVEKKL